LFFVHAVGGGILMRSTAGQYQNQYPEKYDMKKPIHTSAL
jgi:hypothetical protein